jgi:ParB/RepB/Spo0J family partition protein
MMTTTFKITELALIVPSLTNPRRKFDEAALQELAASIKASGVHQPVLVRPLPSHRLADTFGSRAPGAPLPTYELVAGERRLRASHLAKTETIPAMVRELTDEQVLEIQIIENLQRQDLTELEEAQGYQALMDHASISADQVAKKIGMSRSHVFSRLKLLDLGQDGQEALREGLIDASKALLLARIPSTFLQVKALKEITRPNHPEGVMSHRMAAEWIRERYMLELKRAPFDHTDGSMPPRACTACPSRTGADQDLFADVKGADMCTDPTCYAAKVQEHHSRVRAKWEAAGHEVIMGKEAEALMRYPTAPPEGLLRLDDASDSPTDKPLREELASLLESGELKPVMLANPRKDGELIACVPQEQLTHLLTKAGNKKAAKDLKRRAKESEEREQEYCRERDASGLKREYETGWRLRTLDSIHQALSSECTGMLPVAAAKEICLILLDNTDIDVLEHLQKLLKIDSEDEQAMQVWAQDPAPLSYLQAMQLVISAQHAANLDHLYLGLRAGQATGPDLLACMASAHDIDVDAIKAQLQAEITARELPKADVSLAPAAHATGGRGGKGKSKKEEGKEASDGRAAPAGARARKSRMSAEDAQLGIASALQGIEEVGIGDCAGAGSNPGADAHGNEALTLASEAPAPDEASAGQVQGTEALATAEVAPSVGHQDRSIKRSDVLLEDAVDLVREEGACSVRLLKDKLGVGTDRAMRIISELERDGVVSAPDETRNRKVLVQSC